MSSRKQQNNHTALGEASNAIVDYYNNIAEDYDYSRFENSYGCYIDKQERIVLDKLNINPAHSLDLPCGTGRFLNYADYGCDASANMLKVATRNWPNKTLISAMLIELLPCQLSLLWNVNLRLLSDGTSTIQCPFARSTRCTSLTIL